MANFQQINCKLETGTFLAALPLFLIQFIWPGIFPFDANIYLSSSAALVLLMHQSTRSPWVVPRSWLLVIAIITLPQVWIFFMREGLHAPGGWQVNAALWLGFFCMLLVGFQMRAKDLNTFITVMIAASLLYLCIGWSVWLGITNGQDLVWQEITFALAPTGKLAGPFNNGNILAGALLPAWIFLFWRILNKPSHYIWLFFIILTAGLYDTFCRGAWIAASLISCCMLIALIPSKKRMLCLITAMLIGIALGITIDTLHAISLHSESLLTSTVQGAPGSLHQRIIIWATALNIFINNPFTGVGWGQFPISFWLYEPQAFQYLQNHMNSPAPLLANAFSAHNLTLQILASMGLIGFSVFILWLAMILRIGIIYMRKKHILNSIYFPLWLSLIALLLQAQINITYSQPLPWLLMGFFSGAVLKLAYHRRTVMKNSHLSNITMLALGLVLTFCMVSRAMSWFNVQNIVSHASLNDYKSLQSIVALVEQPRLISIPLTLMGFYIAKSGEHMRLEEWLAPHLQKGVMEIPFYDSFQVLFYAQVTSSQFRKACETGKMIGALKLPKERNHQAFLLACKHQAPNKSFHIGF